MGSPVFPLCGFAVEDPSEKRKIKGGFDEWRILIDLT